MSGAVPRTYVFETFIGGGTYNVCWFVEKFSGVDTRGAGARPVSAEQVLETAAAQLPPGADGLLVLPYWTGALTPYWDSNARGVVRRADRDRTARRTSTGRCWRGWRSSSACSPTGPRRWLEKPIEQIVVLGGGSRSAVWCQIIADVLRRPLLVATRARGTCLGSGMLAAAAVGLHPSIRVRPSRRCTAPAPCTGPTPDRAATYDRLFGVYRQLYPRLRDVFAELSEATR